MTTETQTFSPPHLHTEWVMVPKERLVWLHVYGRWPALEIDHINGNPIDNRLANLREATPSQNQANKRSVCNTSGAKGVRRIGKSDKWTAAISCHGKNLHLGSFDSMEDAAAAYRMAAVEHYGEFAKVD